MTIRRQKRQCVQAHPLTEGSNFNSEKTVSQTENSSVSAHIERGKKYKDREDGKVQQHE